MFNFVSLDHPVSKSRQDKVIILEADILT